MKTIKLEFENDNDAELVFSKLATKKNIEVMDNPQLTVMTITEINDSELTLRIGKSYKDVNRLKL